MWTRVVGRWAFAAELSHYAYYLGTFRCVTVRKVQRYLTTLAVSSY